MRQAFSGVDLRPFGARLVQRATAYPGDANTLLDLSWILRLTGNRELGLATQMQALKLQQHYQLAAASDPPCIRLLAIVSAGDLMANTPLEFLIEQSDVALDLLYVDTHLPLPATLPEHDLIFVAIGESDHNRPLLAHIAQQAQILESPSAECAAVHCQPDTLRCQHTAASCARYLHAGLRTNYARQTGGSWRASKRLFQMT